MCRVTLQWIASTLPETYTLTGFAKKAVLAKSTDSYAASKGVEALYGENPTVVEPGTTEEGEEIYTLAVTGTTTVAKVTFSVTGKK